MSESIYEQLKVYNSQYLDFSVHKIYAPRPIKQAIHNHPMLEISLLKEGKGRYCIKDQRYDMKTGDIFIINNIEEHGIELEQDQSQENLVIHFEPRLIWVPGNPFDSRYLKIFFDRNSKFSHRLDRNNKVTEEIKNILLEIENEFIEKQQEYSLMVKVKLMNILVLLLRHYGYVKEEKNEKNYYEVKHLNKVLEYIDQNYCNEIKMQVLADIACMNVTYFSTFFKKYNGITPTEYITRRRITRAEQYLKATDKTILEIAGLCGFNNSANFNKMFKKVTKKTPSTFR